MVKRGKQMRVDKDLATIIEEFAKENNLSLREASKEIARTLKPKIMEIKF